MRPRFLWAFAATVAIPLFIAFGWPHVRPTSAAATQTLINQASNRDAMPIRAWVGRWLPVYPAPDVSKALAWSASKDVVDALLDAGASFKRADKLVGGSMLAFHCGDAYTHANEGVRVYMVEKGAAVNTSLARSGETPLHRAAAFALPAFTKALLQAGADPNAKDKRGATPMDHLSYADWDSYRVERNPEILRLLVQQGGRPSDPPALVQKLEDLKTELSDGERAELIGLVQRVLPTTQAGR